MANPTISQITIGSNTYDVCDATARNLATPKLLFINLDWLHRNQMSHTYWCGHQLISQGNWRGKLWILFQGHVDFNDTNGNGTTETWGQIHAFISHSNGNAGNNYHIFPNTHVSSDNINEAPYVEWSSQRITVPKSTGAYPALRLHTESISTYTNQTNFSSRMTTCAYVASGGTRIWRVSYHSNATFLYLPASIEDNTTISQGATTISSSASEDGSNGNPETNLLHFVANYS